MLAPTSLHTVTFSPASTPERMLFINDIDLPFPAYGRLRARMKAYWAAKRKLDGKKA